MLKHLFSPWRSEYIESMNSSSKKKVCLFCSLAKNSKDDEKNLVAYRGKHCFVVMNKFPYNSGHLMIVPYKHTGNPNKISPDEYAEIMGLFVQCTNALSQISHPQGFNFGANIGKVAGAGIDKHIHFHLVPRWSGDSNFMPVISDIRVISEDTKKMCKKLNKALVAFHK